MTLQSPEQLLESVGIKRREMRAPDSGGVEVVGHKGIVVALNPRASEQFQIYTSERQVLLVRLKADDKTRQEFEGRLAASCTQGEISMDKLKSFLANSGQKGVEDVILCEDKRGNDPRGESTRTRYLIHGGKRDTLHLSRTSSAQKGVDFVIEQSSASELGQIAGWLEKEGLQSFPRTTVLTDTNHSLFRRLTGGIRRGEGGAEVSQHWLRPTVSKKRSFMDIVTEADYNRIPLPISGVVVRAGRVVGEKSAIVVIR